jgi:ADP-ribose pyrophosphatase YjhB (NUDIX family)
VLDALAGEHPEPASVRPCRVAVVALTDPTGAVLLQLRGPGAPVEPGQWGLPGGPVEADETPARAAARVLAEETGLVVRLNPRWQRAPIDVTHHLPAGRRSSIVSFCG